MLDLPIPGAVGILRPTEVRERKGQIFHDSVKLVLQFALFGLESKVAEPVFHNELSQLLLVGGQLSPIWDLCPSLLWRMRIIIGVVHTGDQIITAGALVKGQCGTRSEARCVRLSRIVSMQIPHTTDSLRLNTLGSTWQGVENWRGGG
jgi:hypothetical protein